MNHDVYLIGAGGHAKVVYDTALQLGLRISILVEKAYLNKAQFMGSPILDLESEINQRTEPFLCAIGSIVVRKRLHEYCISRGWQAKSIISSTASIANTSSIGDGTFVGINCIVNPDSYIGRNCIINTAAIIEHDCQIDNHVNISPNATLCGGVSVGTGSEIGASATVLPKVTIGSGCVIAAGAVVVRDVHDGEKVMGVPAR